MVIKDYGKKNDSLVFMNLRIRGGSFKLLHFNNLENDIIREFAKEAPNYRLVCRGLSLKGVCKNEKCEAFEDSVITNLGMGTFNINMEVHN